MASQQLDVEFRHYSGSKSLITPISKSSYMLLIMSYKNVDL